MKKDQEMYITFPADPTAPVLVKITPGPIARAATRLAGTPDSGWESTPCDEEGVLAFLVDPKLLHPHPKRKPRPDAAGHLAKHNEEKKAKAAQPADAEPKADTPAPAKPWDGFEF